MTSKFGGIPVQETSSKFGGVPLNQPSTTTDSDFSFAEMAKNIPESGVQVGKDIYQAIRHPKETVSALANTLAGVALKAVPGEQEKEKYADAMWEFAKDRYGSEENIKNTIESDPVGFIMDVASIFSGVGGGAKIAASTLAKTGKAPIVAQKIQQVGDIASKVGVATDPLAVTGKGIGKVGSYVTGSLPETIYKHAAGLPTNMSIKNRLQAISTALENSIPLTQHGIDKLWTKINTIDDKVKNIVKSGDYKNVSIDEMNKHIDEVIDFYKDVPDSATELKYLEKLKADNKVQFAKDHSAPRIHQMKKNVYKQLQKAYSTQQPVPVVKADAKIAFARGAMQELENLFPEIKNMNKQESSYLNLFKAIEKSVPRIANQKYGLFNPFNLTIAGSVGYGTGSVPAAIGALGAFLVIKNPVVQSHLAIALNKAKIAGKITEVIPPGSTKALFQAGRAEEWTEDVAP